MALAKELHGRMADDGYREWVHQDLSRLIVAFCRDIESLSPPDSEFRRTKEHTEQKYREADSDTKLRMLEHKGTVERLRDEWESGRIVSD